MLFLSVFCHLHFAYSCYIICIFCSWLDTYRIVCPFVCPSPPPPVLFGDQCKVVLWDCNKIANGILCDTVCILYHTVSWYIFCKYHKVSWYILCKYHTVSWYILCKYQMVSRYTLKCKYIYTLVLIFWNSSAQQHYVYIYIYIYMYISFTRFQPDWQ